MSEKKGDCLLQNGPWSHRDSHNSDDETPDALGKFCVVQGCHRALIAANGKSHQSSTCLRGLVYSSDISNNQQHTISVNPEYL